MPTESALPKIDRQIAKGVALLQLFSPNMDLLEFERKKILWRDQTELVLNEILEARDEVDQIIRNANKRAEDNISGMGPASFTGRAISGEEAAQLKRKRASEELRKEISHLQDIRELIEFAAAG